MASICRTAQWFLGQKTLQMSWLTADTPLLRQFGALSHRACAHGDSVTIMSSVAHQLAQVVATALVQRIAEDALGAMVGAQVENQDVADRLEGVPAAQLSRLCFVLGHVGLQHLVCAKPA